MKKMTTILGLVLMSSTVFAGAGSLVCEGKALNLKTSISITLNEGQGMLPIDLGKGRTLNVSFFKDDVRFTELRQATQEERNSEGVNKKREGPYLEGILVAYSQALATESITEAQFITEDVELSCELKP